MCIIHTRTQHPGTLLSVINGTARQVIEKALLTLPLTQGRDGLCSGEGRAAPAPAPPLLCLSSNPPHARGGKRHGILRARLDRACRPWLESKHVSVRLPQASVLAAETAARLPHADRLSPLLSHVWEWSFKSRLLAGQRLYRSHFLSLFDPWHCRGACGWLFACPEPCQSLPSQPSLTELCSTPAAKAPSQGSLGD